MEAVMEPPTEPATEELTAAETAAALNCSRTYLYTLIARDKLHPIKKPTVVKHPPLRFDRAEVIALQREMGIPALDEPPKAPPDA